MALCECGCGLAAPVARQTDRRRGYAKGQSVRFISGHNSPPSKLSDEERRARWNAKQKAAWKNASPEQRQHVLDRKERYRRENMVWVFNYLYAHPCVDCDETDPVVLEFDHVAGKTKAISVLVVGHSLRRIREEIARCEVVCANCHKRRTAKRGGFFSYMAYRPFSLGSTGGTHK